MVIEMSQFYRHPVFVYHSKFQCRKTWYTHIIKRKKTNRIFINFIFHPNLTLQGCSKNASDVGNVLSRGRDK